MIAWQNKKAHIIKFVDGQRRRMRLYVDACIIKKIMPSICFDQLLYNLVFRRHHYYDNSDRVITNSLLIEDAKTVICKDLAELDFIAPTKHGLFTTSKEYCKLNGLNRISYSRTIMQGLHYDEIKKWYDPNKSVSDNLEYAKQNGIKISLSTLRKYCLHNNINLNPNKVEISKWYNPNLSVKDNYNFAINNGIKVRISSIYPYCKKHGIKKNEGK